MSPSSAPKKIAAACKMSLDRFRSRFSLRSSNSSLCSSVVSPPRTPSSISACLTYDRSDSVPTPSWRATRVITPWSFRSSRRRSRTIRVARSFSSGDNRFDVGFLLMLHPHFQGQKPPGYPGRFNRTQTSQLDKSIPATMRRDFLAKGSIVNQGCPM